MQTLQELIQKYEEESMKSDIIDSTDEKYISYSDSGERFIPAEYSSTWYVIIDNSFDIWKAMHVVYGDDPEFIAWDESH